MSSEEDVIRKRLAVEGEGGGDDKRVMALLRTFIRWCNSGQLSAEESEATYQKMLFTLGQCEFSFAKTQSVLEMNKLEMQRFELIYKEIEESIEEVKGQIEAFKEELKQSRVIRRHRQEYDSLAKVIQKHPPRDISHDKIAELDSKLSRLADTRDSLSQKLALRRKQFHLLVHSVHQLQDMLSREPQSENDTAMEIS